MTRKLYDSVAWSVIPTTAQMVAPYVDGRYAWPQAALNRFPNAVHVPIAVFSTTDAGVVGDCEAGCMTVAGAVQWVVMRRKAGVDPTIYCSVSLWETVIRYFHNAGVAQPHYWVAHYDGKPELPSIVVLGIGTFTAVAKQYADPAAGSGGNWDVSIAADYWPGVDGEEVATLDPNDPIVQELRAAAASVVPGVLNAHPAGAEFLETYQVNQTVNTVAGKVDALIATVATLAADVAAIKAAPGTTPAQLAGTFSISGSGTVS